MTIDLYWDNDEQTVMLCEFNGRWTWDELHAVMHTIKKLSVERGQVFGAIIDVRNSGSIPGGNLFSRETLNNFKQLTQMGADGKGPVVVLGMQGMIKSVFDAVKMFDRSLLDDVSFAESMRDARRTIYNVMRTRVERTA